MTTATAPAPAKPSAMSMLGAMAGKAPAKKKDEKPTIAASELQPQADQIIKLRFDIEALEGKLTPLEDQFSKAASLKRLEWCRANGKMVSTVKVAGLTFSQKCQYSKVAAAHADSLREAFGDAYELYFKPKMSVGLSDAAASDEKFLERFVACLIEEFGEDTFKANLVVGQEIGVTETFHADVTLRADVEAKARDFVDSEVIKVYRPTLKE